MICWMLYNFCGVKIGSKIKDLECLGVWNYENLIVLLIKVWGVFVDVVFYNWVVIGNVYLFFNWLLCINVVVFMDIKFGMSF